MVAKIIAQAPKTVLAIIRKFRDVMLVASVPDRDTEDFLLLNRVNSGLVDVERLNGEWLSNSTETTQVPIFR
jgi:hypothetical protein